MVREGMVPPRTDNGGPEMDYLNAAGLVVAKAVVLGLTALGVFAITEAIFPGYGTAGVAGAYAGWILTTDM